jgi:hypothetical protein
VTVFAAGTGAMVGDGLAPAPGLPTPVRKKIAAPAATTTATTINRLRRIVGSLLAAHS